MVTTLPPFVVGNTKEPIKWEVHDKNGNPIAIDATQTSEITFTMWLPGSSTYKVRTTRTAGHIENIADADNNKCRWKPQTGDMDTVGNYLGELYLDFQDGTDARIQDLIIPIVAAGPDQAPP